MFTRYVLERLCLCALDPSCVHLHVQPLGWRLCKWTNLAGFAWVQTGRQLDNGPCSACWKNPFKGAASRECHIIFSLSLFLSSTVALSLPLVLSVSLGWEMAMARIGKGCGRFGKRLFPSLTFSLPLTLCCYRLVRGHIQDEKQVSQEKCESLYAFSWYQHQLPLSPTSCLSPLLSLLTLQLPILSLSLLYL